MKPISITDALIGEEGKRKREREGKEEQRKSEEEETEGGKEKK